MAKLEYVSDVSFDTAKIVYDSPYMLSYMEAFDNRFGAAAPEVVPVPAAAPAAPVVAKRYFKRRAFVITVVLVLSLLVVAFAALSALNLIAAIEDYTKVIDAENVKTIAQNAIKLFDQEDVAIFEYVAPFAFLAALVLALVVFILAIVAFAAKKRLHIWIAALLGLIFSLAAGGAWYMIFKPENIVEFLNPTVSGGLQYGYIIVAGLSLITFIFSCFAYKRIRK